MVEDDGDGGGGLVLLGGSVWKKLGGGGCWLAGRGSSARALKPGRSPGVHRRGPLYKTSVRSLTSTCGVEDRVTLTSLYHLRSAATAVARLVPRRRRVSD